MNSIENCVKVLKESYQHDAEGDRCVMFAALYNKKEDPSLIQERHKRPERTRVIHKKLEAEFSIKGLPKWGATAVRGDLMDNKEHIRKFIDAVNHLSQQDVQEAWVACCHEYKNRMDAKYVPIELNPEDSLVDILEMLVFKRSGGRVQQPLCSAVTEKLYSLIGSDFQVATKKVFAGDAQSNTKGDIQVIKNNELVSALEVKAHQVDAPKLQEVFEDHGQHGYSLVILGESFHKDATPRQNSAICSIRDYIFSTLNHIAAIEGSDLETVSRDVLQRYNDIMINIEDKPDLSVKLD